MHIGVIIAISAVSVAVIIIASVIAYQFLQQQDDPIVIATVALVVATLVAGAISALAIWLTAKGSENMLKKQLELIKQQHSEQLKQSNRQHQVQGLLEAFRTLNSTRHRDSRRYVYSLYHQYVQDGQIELFRGYEVEDVRADFDIMGKLVESGNIDRNEFLEEYGSLAHRCWKCLEDHIEHERDLRNFPPFMTYFQWLAKEGYKYWKDKGYDLDETVLHHPDDKRRKFNFEKKKKGSPI